LRCMSNEEKCRSRFKGSKFQVWGRDLAPKPETLND
jgi:hypothetical protein